MPRYQRGVSLLELLIGVAIVSILLAVGMPTFGLWIQNTQVRTAAESVQNGLQVARNEAVRRNTSVRFNLTSSAGLVAWRVCVVAGSDCGEVIQQRSDAEGGANARVGVSTVAPPAVVPATQYATALVAGAGLSEEGGAGVTFNGVGLVPTANIGTDITRVDIINTSTSDARRLVVVVSTGGLIRMCDPAHTLASNPQGCA
ncbi:MAG: GspH/FimT family pseudopilin [Pseudomonadota bacterium]